MTNTEKSKHNKRVIVNTPEDKEKLLSEIEKRREALKDWVLCVDL